MNHIISILFLGLFACSAVAQSAGDALRYSYWQYGGSARYLGTGASMGALGGDYSAVVNNPASIATYRRSELTFTPGFTNTNTKSNFDNNTRVQNLGRLNINEAAVVFGKPRPSIWRTVNFGIGYSRLAEFNQQFTYRGRSEGSIANFFLDQAQGLDPSELSDFDAGVAADVGLLYQPISDPTYYENDFQSGDMTEKFQTVNARGSLGEMNITVGANYNHKLYLGGGIGVAFLNYDLTKVYEENDTDGSIPYYEGLVYNERLVTSGTGFNLKLGAIYRASQAVRLGVSVHTPTFFTLTDNYGAGLTFDYIENEATAPAPGSATSEFFGEDGGFFEYKQRTPWRIMAQGGFIFKKLGFLSAEVEYLNYGSNRYNYNTDFVTQEILAVQDATNADIDFVLSQAVNVKLGAEAVLAKVYRVRAGYALFGNPYEANDGIFDGSRFSLGAGWRKDDYFVDIAYARSMFSEQYSPYVQDSVSPIPIIDNNVSRDMIVITGGIKFGGRNTAN